MQWIIFMSITLNELLAWRDSLSDRTSEESQMLGVTIAAPAALAVPASAPITVRKHEWSTATVVELYRRMLALEALVAPTPGFGCGIEGVRIMHTVALMSKARSAQLAKLRMSGTQAFYRHM